MKHSFTFIRQRFITGLLVLLPTGITVWVLYKIFDILDSILGTVLYKAIGMRIPGLGLLITLSVVLGVGVFASNLALKRMAQYVESLFVNLPIIKTIYVPVKDILQNFSNSHSNNFQKAVLVTYPSEGIQSIGFITKEHVLVGEEIKTTVFIPTTPNPTSGFLVYVTPDKYIELDMPVDVALKSIISLGAAAPNIISKDQKRKG